VKELVLLEPAAVMIEDTQMELLPWRMLVHDVYVKYQKYCTAKGQYPKGASQFGKEFLKQLGIKTPQKSGGKRYYPVMLKAFSDAGYDIPEPEMQRETQQPSSRTVKTNIDDMLNK